MTKPIPNNTLTLIGRAERILFVAHGPLRIPAKIDTGADISSVWATSVSEHDGTLAFQLFGPASEYYSGETVTLPAGEYRKTRIANSFGAKEIRYVVKLQVEINGRIVTGSFSLANRSQKIYPVLLGRKLLAKNFLVDVSQGEPLLAEEKDRRAKMRVELSQPED